MSQSIEVALVTDIGRKRSSNQDYINRYSNRAGIDLIMLADGMGGYKAGHVASEMTVTDMGTSWSNTTISDLKDIREWLIAAIESESHKIHELGGTPDYKGMGTTLEATVIADNQLMHAHVGDSRLYLLRGETLEQLTVDHSLVEELVQSGQLTEEEAKNHPQKNIITRAIGQDQAPEIDITLKSLETGDVVLICSDGLTNMLSTDDIRDILLSDISLSEKGESLIRFANNAGGLDNISVGIIAVQEESEL